ncbi:MAG: hypothetical protein UU64_C0012G0013 [candidate division WWE3 bacterium GW2011_GWF2_41_45]|uniref:Uncharacterized protein n=2 Tax=Katanobacteria TaxID=422282 RepID=A0A0G0VSK8_UNCKA|nr:MAG: hypothetical protein UU55_C0013G0013 [candidate division WWE3 bacterium GW2011_GWC2_41_23]KKS09970.1 MAG: hypothetical protein UU64_C0012G0013 [candidate division WWE3 bacterium GW2011_GWF2_41_45]KKS19796.1 MAG: hypothetical protein UU79_C0009G0007 [candidate division WWE3 bacterium GW2011_GWE1_41_72]KKS27213.1 MAG: hypothetical protein UU86_C0023G0015 [candidate division WWE3 bacterium GW2011_GWC1_42_102]KKS30240.1 MAG: hypothetical protein UU90_C0004G0020 [candidate division WWE3 bact
MEKKSILSLQTQFIISAVVAIVFLASVVERSAVNAVFIVLASLLGTIVLDLEYPLYAYLFEPEKGFSKNFKNYIKDKDYRGALKYVFYNRGDVVDKSLNSALFQIIFAVLTILVAYTSTSRIATALVFSVFANSIFKMWEHYFNGQTDEWFWALKNKPDKKGVIVYSAAMILVLVVSFLIV